jgi:hypothetical protein
LIRRGPDRRTGTWLGRLCRLCQTLPAAFSYSQTLRRIRSSMKSCRVREIGTVLTNLCQRSFGILRRKVTSVFCGLTSFRSIFCFTSVTLQTIDETECGKLFTANLGLESMKHDGTVHNNKMERMNGEIRQREKVTRTLENPDTTK